MVGDLESAIGDGVFTALSANSLLSNRAEVTFQNPKDVSGEAVNFYLLDIRDDPLYRNTPPAGFRDRGIETRELALELTYLVTCHGARGAAHDLLIQVRRWAEHMPALTLSDGSEVRIAVEPKGFEANAAVWLALRADIRPCWYLHVRLRVPG